MGCKVLLVASIGAVGNKYQIGQFGGLIFYPPLLSNYSSGIERAGQVFGFGFSGAAIKNKVRSGVTAKCSGFLILHLVHGSWTTVSSVISFDIEKLPTTTWPKHCQTKRLKATTTHHRRMAASTAISAKMRKWRTETEDCRLRHMNK